MQANEVAILADHQRLPLGGRAHRRTDRRQMGADGAGWRAARSGELRSGRQARPTDSEHVDQCHPHHPDDGVAVVRQPGARQSRRHAGPGAAVRRDVSGHVWRDPALHGQRQPTRRSPSPSTSRRRREPSRRCPKFLTDINPNDVTVRRDLRFATTPKSAAPAGHERPPGAHDQRQAVPGSRRQSDHAARGDGRVDALQRQRNGWAGAGASVSYPRQSVPGHRDPEPGSEPTPIELPKPWVWWDNIAIPPGGYIKF